MAEPDEALAAVEARLPRGSAILLSGIVGSTAYGLAGPDSDVDRAGIFAAPTSAFHGLEFPQETHEIHKPDVVVHEARKWCRLALACNPSILELLWLPEHLYERRTPAGVTLIKLREFVLSARRVKDAYLGYATQQFKRLERRDDGSFSADTRKRTAKHARHLRRLLTQGIELYQTGELNVEVDHPELYFEFGERVAAEGATAAEPLMASATIEFEEPSALPGKPGRAWIDGWLKGVRAQLAEPVKTSQAMLTHPVAPYVPPLDKPRAVIVDIDGTLALRGDRSPYDETNVDGDEPNPAVVATVRALHADGYQIVCVSGRSSSYAATTSWLEQHVGIPVDGLFLRPSGDLRKDAVIKAEIFDHHIRDHYNVQFVLDDRDQVVRMWRDQLGLTVFQVADGNF